jgi:adenosylhomocysteinase
MIKLVAGLGNPIEAMDLGLTLQARSLAAIAAGHPSAGVQPVPDDIDQSIAAAFWRSRTARRRG